MKGMKKLLSILMVLTLVMSLGATAFAATAKVTISSDKEGLDTAHTYRAYKIFTGTQADTAQDTDPIGDIDWGDGVNSTAFLKALQDDETFGDTFDACTTAKDVAKIVEGFGTDTDKIKLFGKIALQEGVKGSYTELVGDGAGNASADLETGCYYVIEDVTDSLGDGEVKNDIVVEVVGDVTITAKNEGPKSDKKVKDINDSTENKLSDWQDSADHDINDQVEYRLHAHIPATALKAYETYLLNFVDVISKGLSYNNDAEIWVGEKDTGTNITASFDAEPDVTAISDASAYGEEYVGGNKLTWSCEDIKKIAEVAAATGDVDIYIYYTATLNENAVIGTPGNPNEFQIEYNRNPNGDEKGTTPWDINIVFTYDFKGEKVDGETKEALKGAEFRLLKKLAAGTTAEAPELVTDIDEIDNGTAKYYRDGDDVVWQILTLTKSGSEENIFTREGLDDGEYKLVETTTPKGYNTMEPIDFKIEATHEENDEKPTLTNLTNGGSSLEWTFQTTGEYNVSGQIANEKGVTLPETGGIGTTIFYIAGAVLVIGAMILLVTKKRVSGMEK